MSPMLMNGWIYLSISDILAVKIVNMLSRAAHASAAAEESPTVALKSVDASCIL